MAVRRVLIEEVAVIERDIVEPSQIKPGTRFVGLKNIASGGRLLNVRPVDSGELASSKFAFTPQICDRWPNKNLGSLLEFLTSGSRGWAKHYTDNGDLFLRIQNVRRDELDLHDIAYVRPPLTLEAKRTCVEAGDVLLSITADLGRTAVVPQGLGRAFINQHLAILRTKSLVPRFLSAFLASPTGQQEVSGLNRHGVKAGLNFDDIRSMRIPVPPFDMQRSFAERIARVEALRVVGSASTSQLDALFGVIQHRAFSGEL